MNESYVVELSFNFTTYDDIDEYFWNWVSAWLNFEVVPQLSFAYIWDFTISASRLMLKTYNFLLKLHKHNPCGTGSSWWMPFLKFQHHQSKFPTKTLYPEKFLFSTDHHEWIVRVRKNGIFGHQIELSGHLRYGDMRGRLCTQYFAGIHSFSTHATPHKHYLFGRVSRARHMVRCKLCFRFFGTNCLIQIWLDGVVYGLDLLRSTRLRD